MKKLFFIFMSAFIANNAFGYIGGYNENSMSSKFYRGEISKDEYLDHLGVPKNNNDVRGSVHGELKKNQYGEGYTYRDNTGLEMEFHKKQFGLEGYDIYSNR